MDEPVSDPHTDMQEPTVLELRAEREYPRQQESTTEAVLPTLRVDWVEAVDPNDT